LRVVNHRRDLYILGKKNPDRKGVNFCQGRALKYVLSTRSASAMQGVYDKGSTYGYVMYADTIEHNL